MPATSAASTVRVTQDYGWCRDFCGKIGTGPELIVVYDAAPGEANRLTVGRAGRAITISDPGATVGVVPPCVALDAHTASCDGGKATDVGSDGASLRLGDGDDLAMIGADVQVHAVLQGGEGEDTLRSAQPGDDFDGGPGADRIDAMVGDATLSFRGRRSGVTVDLAAGRTSEGDVINGIAAVFGGHGRDRLLGGPGGEALLGFEGADTLRGRGGRDTLFGGAGPDLLLGGRGSDSLIGGGGADRVVGSPGPDALNGAPATITSPPSTALATRSCVAAGATAPGSMRKTACALAKTYVAVAILRRVDQAFPHSSAAHSLTPRRTAIA